MLLDKIDPHPIIVDHLDTLYDHSTGKRATSDLVLFFVVPAVIAAAAVWLAGVRIRLGAMTGILTTSAIFIGLLPSLLVLVLSFLDRTKGDAGDLVLQSRKTFMREISANVSFAFILSLLLATLTTTALLLLRRDDQPTGLVLSFSIIAASVSLLLTLLMLIRRMHVLIVSEFDRHHINVRIRRTA